MSARPPDLPLGVGYAPSASSAANGNGHDALALQAHYATLTEVTLPISGLVVTVRPVDGMDLYRLGLPPSFFSRSVQATQELQAPSVADQAGAATTNMELLVQAGDRFAAFAILRPRPVATPELVTGPDTFCPDLLPTSDKVWLINHFVLNGEAQAAVGALFRSDPAGQPGPRLAPAPGGDQLRPAPERPAGPAAGQRRRTGS